MITSVRGTTNRKPASCRFGVLIKARPLHRISRWKLEFLPKKRLRLLDVVRRGHALDIDIDVSSQLTIVVADHLRHLPHRHIRNLPKRNRPSIARNHRGTPNLLHRIDIFRRVLERESHGRAVVPFDAQDIVAADGIPHGVHRFSHGDTLHGHALEVVPNVDVIAFRNAFSENGFRSGKFMKKRFDLLRNLFDRFQRPAPSP